MDGKDERNERGIRKRIPKLIGERVIKFLIYLSVTVATVLFVRWLVLVASERALRTRLKLDDGGRIANSILMNILRPLSRPLSQRLINLHCRTIDGYIKRLLVHAGIDEQINVADFLSFHIVLAGLLAILGVFIGGALVVIICGAVGVLFPPYWLFKVIKQRKEEILRSLPAVTDMLTLSIEAGLDFMAALMRVAEGLPKNPFVQELKKMLSDVRVGSSRSDALRRMAIRCDMPEINSFCALLIQADRLGASVGPVLRALSDKVRSERFQRAERAGAIAAQKILFPLVFCIIPAVFIVIFGPLIVRFLTNGIFIQ